MKKQVKLTESELFDVIRESVKNLVMEFGEKNPKVRDYRAKKSAEDLKKGDASTYETSVKSMGDCGADNETMADFQNKFEKHGVKEATDFDKRNWYGSEGYYDYDDTADSPVEEYNDTELQHIYGRPSYDEDFDDVLNGQPANNLAAEGRKAFKVNESQLKDIIRESVMRILQEEYTGDEPFVPNKYPGEIPNFRSKEEYRNWRSKEAPNDWFDWRDDRKCQRTGIQPGYSAFATRAMKDRRDGKMSWSSDKNYNKFQMLKQKNGIQ